MTPTVCRRGESPAVLTPDNGEDIRDGRGGGDGTGDAGLTPPQHCRGGCCHLHGVNLQGCLITDRGLPNKRHAFNFALCNRQNNRLHWVQITITDTWRRTRKQDTVSDTGRFYSNSQTRRSNISLQKLMWTIEHQKTLREHKTLFV